MHLFLIRHDQKVGAKNQDLGLEFPILIRAVKLDSAKKMQNWSSLSFCKSGKNGDAFCPGDWTCAQKSLLSIVKVEVIELFRELREIRFKDQKLA